MVSASRVHYYTVLLVSPYTKGQGLIVSTHFCTRSLLAQQLFLTGCSLFSHSDILSSTSGGLTHLSLSMPTPLSLPFLSPLSQKPPVLESPIGIVWHTSSMAHSADSQVKAQSFLQPQLSFSIFCGPSTLLAHSTLLHQQLLVTHRPGTFKLLTLAQHNIHNTTHHVMGTCFLQEWGLEQNLVKLPLILHSPPSMGQPILAPPDYLMAAMVHESRIPLHQVTKPHRICYQWRILTQEFSIRQFHKSDQSLFQKIVFQLLDHQFFNHFLTAHAALKAFVCNTEGLFLIYVDKSYGLVCQ